MVHLQMQFFPVEYSSLSVKDLLQLAILRYNLGDDSSIRFLKRGFNDTYLIHNDKHKYILRVYKYNWRKKESIETEIELLNYLEVKGISVSFPIKDQEGNFIQTIPAPEAVLFSFAEGEQIRKLNLEQSYLLGVQVGRMHTQTQNKVFGTTAHNYDIEHQFEITLKTLKPILKDHAEQYEYLLKLKDDFTSVFKGLDKNELATGICHGDLQAENFHITNDNTFTFFDFDFFGQGYLAYDIGVFMWYDHKNKSLEIMSSFLKGYQTQRKLTETEIKLIPYFSTLRALFQMTLYCNTSDGKQLPVWPEQQIADFIGKVEKWQREKVKTQKF